MNAKKEFINRLMQIDEELDRQMVNVKFVLVGSGPLVLEEAIDRRIPNLNFINALQSEAQSTALIAINNKLKSDGGFHVSNSIRNYLECFFGYENVISEYPGLNFKRIVLQTPIIEHVLASKCFTQINDNDLVLTAESNVEIDIDRFEEFVINIWSNCSLETKNKLIARLPQIEKMYTIRQWNFDSSTINQLVRSIISK